jgi:hypothetical protein
MIAADRFLLDGDTAWWVLTDDEWLRTPLSMQDAEHDLDRPCETCGGTGTNPEPEYNQSDDCQFASMSDDEWREMFPCPDCIDGRHTFDIEVGSHEAMPLHPDWLNPEAARCGGCARTYRVSIVPGMVLPIVEMAHCEDDAHICHNVPWSHTGWLHHAALTTDRHIETEWPVTLPSAAAPGMWAVKLRVAS